MLDLHELRNIHKDLGTHNIIYEVESERISYPNKVSSVIRVNITIRSYKFLLKIAEIICSQRNMDLIDLVFFTLKSNSNDPRLDSTIISKLYRSLIIFIQHVNKNKVPILTDIPPCCLPSFEHYYNPSYKNSKCTSKIDLFTSSSHINLESSILYPFKQCRISCHFRFFCYGVKEDQKSIIRQVAMIAKRAKVKSDWIKNISCMPLIGE